VSCTWFDPSAFIVKTLVAVVSRVLVKANFAPVGDQSGSKLSPTVLVICFWSEPSGFIVNISSEPTNTENAIRPLAPGSVACAVLGRLTRNPASIPAAINILRIVVLSRLVATTMPGGGAEGHRYRLPILGTGDT
jgi:hypothetical protein